MTKVSLKRDERGVILPLADRASLTPVAKDVDSMLVFIVLER
jgi:hypothetical protein